MVTRYFRGAPARLLLTLGIASVAIPSLPQIAAAQESVLEVVVVTARRREESLQETPVAVTALNATELREASVYNLADLNEIVPSIEVQHANGNAQVANIYIRGIGQRNQAPMIDSGVGIYYDDVYIGRSDGALLDMLDVESVQILRGPQGTLFGKNTTGGAIVFTTTRPTDEFEASFETRLGDFGRADASFIVNAPLSESWLSRFAVASINRDGYIRNAYDGERYGDEDRINALAKFRWLATDDLTFDFDFTLSETDQKSRLQKCMPLPGVIGWQAVLLDSLQVLPATGRSYDDFCQDAADLGNEYDVISDLGGMYASENRGASIVADWSITDTLSLKSISAWRSTLAGLDDDLDYTALPLLHEIQFQHVTATSQDTDQYSQEFQLVGDALDGRISYVAGVHYFSEETNGDRGVIQIGPFDPGVNDLFMLTGNSTLFETDNRAWALFSEFEWLFDDRWSLSAGYRYTDEKRQLDREAFAVIPESLDASGSFVFPAFPGAWVVDRASFEFNPDFGFASAGLTSATTENDDSSILASLKYGIDGARASGSAYLTYSESFLSGGLSEAPGGTLEVFEPEEVENLEFGVKLDLLDRRLRLNAAVFRSDYTNRQLTAIVIDPVVATPAPATINAAKSRISGLELETTWLASDRLQVIFNVAFNDGEIQEFEDVQLRLTDPSFPVPPGCERADLTIIFVDSCLIDRSSENLPRLPERSFYAALQYDFDTAYGVFIPRLQASYKDNIDYCFDATSCAVGNWLADRQVDVSARVSWAAHSGNWSGSVYGRNLTGETYVIGGTALAESSGVGGIAVNLPRMYGVEARYSF